ncbi:MAG TPA: hypothetical protein PKN28_04225 [Clostridiales bacterium]|jgi:hypothetical protein|nr:hypothetical protein [Clostridiales bacterium]
MNVLFFITRIITFFGSSLRCFWEFVVCRIFKLPIEDIRCFKISEMCSHIEHEITEKAGQSFLLCALPFALNFCLGSCFLAYSSYYVFYAGVVNFNSVFFLIIGISLYSNLFPSVENALSLKDNIYSGEGKNLFVKIILAPFTALMLFGAYLEKYSLSVLASIAAAIAFPFITDPIFYVISRIMMELKS